MSKHRFWTLFSLHLEQAPCAWHYPLLLYHAYYLPWKSTMQNICDRFVTRNSVLFIVARFRRFWMKMLMKYRNILTRRYSSSHFQKNLTVMGIETSCDDSGIAIIRREEGNNKVLANILNSQQSFHIRWLKMLKIKLKCIPYSKLHSVFHNFLIKPNEIPHCIRLKSFR